MYSNKQSKNCNIVFDDFFELKKKDDNAFPTVHTCTHIDTRPSPCKHLRTHAHTHTHTRTHTCKRTHDTHKLCKRTHSVVREHSL